MIRRTIRTLLAVAILGYAFFALIQIHDNEPFAWLHAIAAAALLMLVFVALGRRARTGH